MIRIGSEVEQVNPPASWNGLRFKLLRRVGGKLELEVLRRGERQFILVVLAGVFDEYWRKSG